MTDITIPREAWEAAKAEVERYRSLPNPNLEDMTHAACFAMLRAWPGMKVGPKLPEYIILPLTEKPSHE